jgi:hypothetical protein
MTDWVEEMSEDERREWDAFVHHFRTDTLAKMVESAFVASLVPSGDFDVKFALETGAAIMLDKPIVAIVQPGGVIPRKLRLVADEVVEADIDTEAGRRKVMEALKRMGAL